VIRRYNEFSWLSTELSREFPGVIVPPLPDKQSVGRFSAEFVESRRRALEKFLQRIIAHAELVTSQSVIIFLQADDATLNKVKTDKKAEKPKLATSASAWFQGTVNSISNGKVGMYFKCLNNGILNV
jgi:sorting nexin-1/2